MNVNLLDFSVELINQLISSMSTQQEEEFQNQNHPNRCILQSVHLKSLQNIHQHPIISIIQSISKQHHHAFATLQQKCLNVQQSISQLVHIAQTLAKRVQRYSDDKEGEILNKMKIKQSEFIIGELKNAITKLNKKQETISEELDQSKRLVERYREEKYKMEVQNEALLQKIDRIEAKMKANTLSTATMNNQEEIVKQKLFIQCKSDECLELEDRLSKISSQLQYQINVNKSFRIQLEQANLLNSQLQIQLKQQSAELLEFQSNYKQIVQSSKDSDVSLHKQLQEHKLKEITMIKEHKTYKKMFRQQLTNLADFIANGKYYFVNTQINGQIQQIKQLYEKSLKRKLQHKARQLDYIQLQYKRTKQIAGQLEQKVHQMQKSKSVIESSSDKSLDSSISLQRNCSQNGSYLAHHHHSYESNDHEKHKHLDEKYKSKVQALRKEIKIKNAKIDELEKLEVSLFDQNKEKLLQLELAISQKNNQIRKYQLNIKEKQHEQEENQNKINDLQNKAKQMSDKLQKEKDAHLKLIDSKVTNYEEKIKVLKNNLKQLEAKEQQKTMKYNLLKNKHQKYELQASESLNRKKSQIDQLLKQNKVLAQRMQTLEDTMKQIQMNPISGNDNQNANQAIQFLKKQLQQKNKEIKALRGKIDRLKQNRKQLQLGLSQQKQQKQRIFIDMNRRISEMAAKQSQLIDIINYKNRQGNTLRESMMGEQLMLQEESKLKLSIDTMTDQVMTCQIAINTDLSLDHQNAEQAMIMQDWPNQKEEAETYINKLLVPDELQQNFDIGDEDEVVNIGQSSNNLQVKESFNVLRHSIEKIFNEQEITLSVVRLLPRQLEDDFNDFVWYIKQKIHEIRNSNNLTFIMAESGSQPSIEEIQTSLQQFLSKPSIECIKLKKIIQEKQFTIISLMSEKTQQQNTISQQQNAQQQTQRLYLQQFSVLKKEIQYQKQTIDKQTVYYESIKNILKKMMAFWVDDEDNCEDFQDNLNIVTTIYKFSIKELDLLKQYLAKYKKIKHIK